MGPDEYRDQDSQYKKPSLQDKMPIFVRSLKDEAEHDSMHYEESNPVKCAQFV
jgi:hypothetical protein